MTSLAQISPSFGDTRESKFTIQANGTAFKILSDGLYANKILAVVRELCCNAYDAHVMAGTQSQPFIIHLPSYDEPYFSIQDFGIGLTEFEACGGYEDVVIPAGSLNPDGSVVKADYVVKEYVGGIYNTFFKSPKADRKDQIGALGLGSKSPLSYTDQFDVISVKNGIKIFFSVYLNDAGEPAIAKLAEHPTTEPSGLKIILKVKTSHLEQFKEACAIVLEWFDVAPKIENNEYFKAKKRTYLAQNSEWAMGDQFQSYPAPRAIAVMGKIAYPIEHHHDLLGDSDHTSLLSTPLVMFFENGDLEFAASREALSYSKKTLDAIKAKLSTVVKELPNLVQGDIDSCATLWEAKLRWIEVVSQTSLRNLSNLIKVKFKDQIIDNSYIFIPDEVKGQCHVFTTKGRKTNYVLGYGGYGSKVHVKPDAVLYIDDLEKGMQARAKNYARNTGEFVVYSFSDSVSQQTFMNLVEGCNIKYTSDLPKPDRVGSKYAPKAKNRVLCMGGKMNYGNKFRDETEIDLDDGGFYVPVCRGFPQNSTGTFKDLADYLNNGLALKYLSDTDFIYGLTEVQIKKVTKDPDHKWVNVLDYLKDKLKEQLATNQADFLYTCDAKAWRDEHYYATQMFTNLAGELPEGHMIENFIKAMSAEVDREDVWKRQSMMHLANLLGVVLPTVTNSLRSDFKAIQAEYPLFKTFVGYASSQPSGHEIAEYVKAVDLYRATRSSL